MAKILVTGGAGFVGQHLVKTLLDSGHEIVVLDDFSNGKRENIPHGPKMNVVTGDVADRAVVMRAMEGCEHIVHLAALVSVPLSIEMPERTFASNVVGMQNVLDVAREVGFKGWIIYASSAAVYGGLDQARAAEKDADGAVLLSPYAASKAMGETLGKMYGQVYGLKTVGLRFFNIYGQGQDATSPYSGVLSRVVHSVQTGELLPIYGDGKQTRDFVAVTDVAGVIKALLGRSVDLPMPAVMNLGSGLAVSLLDVIRHIVALKQVYPRVEHQMPRAGDIRLSCADISLLKSVLPGWEPLSLQAGLRRWLG